MSLGQPPLVSIVTPVYNGEPHLRGCVESILRQTYPHWNYVIVDNVSTDGTSALARDLARQDARIRVHSNENFLRVMANYNNALRQISPESKYCKVVAADDRLMPECLERMVALAERNPTVAVVGAYGLIGGHLVWRGLPDSITVVPGPELCRQRLLGGPYVFGTPTSLLYRSDLVRERSSFYNESNLHSDSEACLELLAEHDFGFVHQILTAQGAQKDSLSSFSHRMQTYLPWILYELVTYGPRHLSREELEGRIREQLRRYYAYLGLQVFLLREPSFWAYHREKLSALGHPLNGVRLTGAALACAFDRLRHPRRTAGGALRRLRGLGRQS